MSTLIFDLEGNNLLRGITKIHCIVTMDADTKEITTYYEDDDEIYQGLLALYNADCIIGHNIISFDVPAIRKLYPRWTYKSLYDTFILSCLFNPDRYAHSIESYSGGRKVPIDNWSCLTYEILDRCVIDVIVNGEIFDSFRERVEMEEWKSAIDLEQRVAINHARQVAAGVDVDISLLLSTLGCLDAELEALKSLIEDRMPYRCIEQGTYKKFFKKDGGLLHYVDNYFNNEAISVNDWMRGEDGDM